MARAALARLGLDERALPVVLGGGILRAGDTDFDLEVTAALARELPRAEPIVSSTSPVLGGLLLALEGDQRALARASETYPLMPVT